MRRMFRAISSALMLSVAVLAASCRSDEKPRPTPTPQAMPAPESYDQTALERDRSAKDAAFAQEGSPIPASQRPTFAGLRYFPPAPTFAIAATFERHEQPEPASITATRGDVRKMFRAGIFHFNVDGVACSLPAYTTAERRDQFFVPFGDATNGAETYEGGRYLDIDSRPDDRYLLDFNRAYNPYCAYNKDYTCPIVPRENILTVAIRAGERAPQVPAH